MTNDNYTGVTTGTVATACSLAALDAILDTPDIACVKVETPKKYYFFGRVFHGDLRKGDTFYP